jgi:hypothetical protein
VSYSDDTDVPVLEGSFLGGWHGMAFACVNAVPMPLFGDEFMYETQKKFLLLVAAAVAVLVSIPLSGVHAQVSGQANSQLVEVSDLLQRPKLNQATMCERVDNLAPVRPGMVFSVSNGQVCCYTSFDPVPQATLIYHRWFHRDELSTQTRLRVYPPKWATYSVIQLRDTDKGPWRVEITDQNGRVFNVVRFSIVD